jgi:hypothetical protein
MHPAQCAVFLKSRTSLVPLSPDGKPFPKPADTTCILFESLESAQCFCEAKARGIPELRCEIYDSQGLAHAPLLVIVAPGLEGEDDASPLWAGRRKWIAAGLGVAAAWLFWLAVRRGSDLYIFLALNCLMLALRFLFWEFGVKHHERERKKRLEAHRDSEQRHSRHAGPL